MSDTRDDDQKRMDAAAENLLSIPEVKAWMLAQSPYGVSAKGDELWSSNADETGAVVGYMCLTSWQFEIGSASDGDKIYPSLEELQEHSPCWEDCGVVEVEVRARRIVVPQKDFGQETRE